MGNSEFSLPVGFELDTKVNSFSIVDVYITDDGISKLWNKVSQNNVATSSGFMNAAFAVMPCRDVHELAHLGSNTPCFQYRQDQTWANGRISLNGNEAEKKILLHDLLSSASTSRRHVVKQQ